jgi:chromosome segregation ATPase
VSIDTPPDAPVSEPAAPARASGKGWLIAALVVSGVALLGLTVLTSYLWNVHSQYVAQNEELREVADTLGTDVATAQAHADEVQAQLDQTVAQLEVAKDTINGLANSEAQAGDDRQALVDVAAGLKECADARQDLIDHLNEASRWTPESLRANENSITTYCNGVVKAYQEIVND